MNNSHGLRIAYKILNITGITVFVLGGISFILPFTLLRSWYNWAELGLIFYGVLGIIVGIILIVVTLVIKVILNRKKIDTTSGEVVEEKK